MKRKLTIVLVFLALLALTWGCSGNSGGSGVLPEAQQPSQDLREGTGHWGLYQVSVDLNSETVDIIQLRQADYIINVLTFMEPPAMVNMAIDFDTLVILPDDNYIGVDVILRHPIPDPVFKGFDVRGICIGPEVTNADGLTILMNPADFAGVPFGYMDGLLGAPNSYASYDGIWGYKYFCDGLELEDDLATYLADEDNLLTRGVFNEGSQNTRHYDLSWAETVTPVDFMVFNYAIYANYNWPDGDPPFTVDSFQITAANSFEAICAAGTPVANTVWYVEEDDEGGGMLTLDVEVWDWQGAESATVTIESLEPGIMAQTPSDADIAGTTSKSWIYTFTDVPAVPVSAGDLDILITVTDVEKTFGSAWFFELLDPGHEYYDQLLWCSFITSVPVDPEGPAGGGWIIKTGFPTPLPTTLPVADERNFCVTANDTFGYAGVYYWTGDVGFDISYYPLDYSSASTLYGSIVDPFFGNIGGLLMDVTKLGSIEVLPMGAAYWCNRQTGPMPAWPNPADGPVWWCSPTDFPNLTNGYLYFYMKFVDLEYSYGAAEKIWGFWRNNSAGVDGATYYDPAPYNSSYYSITGYFPVDHSSSGVDGQISELFVERCSIDTNTNSDILGAPWDMMWYYVEQDPGNPSVEVCANSENFAYFGAQYTIDDDELDGLPVDCSTLNNWEDEDFEDVEFNQMALLEDYEDGTWTISVWEWDGTAMQMMFRHDPIDGTPYNLDCDTENHEIHVWADDGGTDTAWIFEWAG